MPELTWELSSEIHDRVKVLLEGLKNKEDCKRFAYLEDFETRKLACVLTNQPPHASSYFSFSNEGAPETLKKRQVASMKIVSRPVSLLTPYRYVLVICEPLWEPLTPEQKDLVLLRHLISIDMTHELTHPAEDVDATGCLLKPDLSDFQGFREVAGELFLPVNLRA